MSDAPPLVIPDVTERAEVRQGRAVCVTCHQWHAVTTMDVVGLGYRCDRCTTIHGDSESVHLRPADARRPRDGWAFLLIGAGFILASMIAVFWSTTAMSILGPIGCVFMGLGYLRTMVARGRPIQLRVVPGLRIKVGTRNDDQA